MTATTSVIVRCDPLWARREIAARRPQLCPRPVSSPPRGDARGSPVPRGTPPRPQECRSPRISAKLRNNCADRYRTILAREVPYLRSSALKLSRGGAEGRGGVAWSRAARTSRATTATTSGRTAPPGLCQRRFCYFKYIYDLFYI